MTKLEIMQAAHAEARQMVRDRKVAPYAEGMKFGLRRVYNKLQREAFVAAAMAQPATPKFMWLRGM